MGTTWYRRARSKTSSDRSQFWASLCNACAMSALQDMVPRELDSDPPAFGAPTELAKRRVLVPVIEGHISGLRVITPKMDPTAPSRNAYEYCIWLRETVREQCGVVQRLCTDRIRRRGAAGSGPVVSKVSNHEKGIHATATSPYQRALFRQDLVRILTQSVRGPEGLLHSALISNRIHLKSPYIFYATETIGRPGFKLVVLHCPRVPDKYPQVGSGESHLLKIQSRSVIPRPIQVTTRGVSDWRTRPSAKRC